MIDRRNRTTKKLFDGAVIGMVHLLPLPGVPDHPGMDRLIEAALRDTEALINGGVDALLLENMHDFPPVSERQMGPEVAAAMTRAASSIRRTFSHGPPLGVQVLFAANRTALAVAAAADLDFVRAEAWSYGHLSDKGWAEASAGAAVRYRTALGIDHVLVLADVKKKHASHAVTADLSLAQVAGNLALHRADAAVITGETTGHAPEPEALQAARAATTLPLVIGSGLTADNASELAPLCHAAIVGSSLKRDGDWRRPVETDRVRRFVDAFHAARS